MRVICSDWYELLRSNEKVFWHTFMTKAQQKIEYRWDDFLAEKQAGKISEEEPYDPVVNFDQRFHDYDKYVDIVALLPETSTREEEEAKSSIWELGRSTRANGEALGSQDRKDGMLHLQYPKS